MKSDLTRWGLLPALILVLLLPACGLFGETEDDQPDTRPSSVYLDFDDIRIPAGLERVRNKSFLYESHSIKAGMISLTGDVDLVDTLNLFQQNMAKDGWVMLSSFKYRENILIYTKPDKVCLIMATSPKPLQNLNMEVWVSPMMDGQFIPGQSAHGFNPLTPRNPLVKSGPLEEDLTDVGESS